MTSLFLYHYITVLIWTAPIQTGNPLPLGCMLMFMCSDEMQPRETTLSVIRLHTAEALFFLFFLPWRQIFTQPLACQCLSVLRKSSSPLSLPTMLPNKCPPVFIRGVSLSPCNNSHVSDKSPLPPCPWPPCTPASVFGSCSRIWDPQGHMYDTRTDSMALPLPPIARPMSQPVK